MTNLADTNGGLWPAPISAFDHFCVKVRITLATDVNLANNAAQTNYFFINPGGPHQFLIGNPFDSEVRASLVFDAPQGFTAEVTWLRFGQPFRLAPRQVRLAEIRLLPPQAAAKRPLAQDLTANLALQIGGQKVGGISYTLAGTAKPEQRQALAPRQGSGWERLVNGNRPQVFQAVLAALRESQEKVALADENQGLIQTVSIPLADKALRELVQSGKVLPSGKPLTGRYLLTFRLSPSTETATWVQVGAILLVDGPEAVITGGAGVPSNGLLEQRHLDLIERLLSSGR